MNDFLKKIIGDKKAWNAMQARAKALPKDYLVVYREIMNYVWGSVWLSDEKTAMELFEGLLNLFEDGAREGRKVLEITGDDVAAFCDELLKGEKTYIEKCRENLNKNISKKLRK